MNKNKRIISSAKTYLVALIIILIILIPSLAIPVTAQSNNLPEYIVQSGDTLYDLAIQFHTSIDKILAVNGRTLADPLLIGDHLFIPGLEGMKGQLITDHVQLGTNLRALSRRTQANLDSLIRLNMFTSQSELFVGRKITITTSDETRDLQTLPALNTNQSWLELALLAGQNPWGLARLNLLSDPIKALPNDPYYYHSGQSGDNNLAIPGITSMTIDNLPLVQGGTFAVTVNSKQPVDIQMKIADTQIVFVNSSDLEQVAFGGINALQEPGAYPLTIQFVFSNEESRYSYDQWLVIKPGNFEDSGNLSVEQDTVDSPEVQEEDERVKQIVTKLTPIKQWEGVFQYPIKGSDCLNADFGSRRTYNGGDKVYYHTGIDLGYCEGIDVFAPAKGTVAAVLPNQLVRGNLLIIDHGLGVYSIYMHLSEFLVNVGDVVEPGQKIAILGNTGRSTGPHLHFEIDINGTPVSPWTWFTHEFP